MITKTDETPLFDMAFTNSLVTGTTGDDTLDSGPGEDTLDGGDGSDTANYATATTGVGANLLRPEFNAGDAAGDVYISIENLAGSAFNDTLVGDNAANRIDGSAGDDDIFAGNGRDTLIGGGGNDTLNGWGGFDIASYATAAAGVSINLRNALFDTTGDTLLFIEGFEGTAFDDTFVGPFSFRDVSFDGLAGNDLALSGYGDDTLLGGDGDDTLLSTRGNDSVVGGAGDDSLDVGEGADTVIGGDGDDTVLSTRGDDSVVGGAGNDSLNVGDGDDTVIGGDGNDTVFSTRGDDSVVGGVGDDSLNVGDGDDTVIGGDGRDTIDGGNGNDLISGGSGDDEIAGVDGNDTVYAGAGDDDIDGGMGDDLLQAGTGNDTVLGDDGNDALFGFGGDDRLSGGAGDDTVAGGDGSSILTGGSGSDLFIIEGGGGDVITDFTPLAQADAQTPADKIDLTAYGFDRLESAPVTDLMATDGSGDIVGSQIVISGSDLVGPGEIGLPVVLRTIDLPGVSASDLTVDDFVLLPTQITGTDAAETLTGTARADSITGLGGADTISGNEGDDIVMGGSGTDSLRGNDGNDTLDGGSNADTLVGGPGDNLLTGGSGIRDVFVIDEDGVDTITDFTPRALGGFEVIDLRGTTASDFGTLRIRPLTSENGEVIGSFVELPIFNEEYFVYLHGPRVAQILNLSPSDLSPEDFLFDIIEIEGTDNNDSIRGSVRGELIRGLGGDDDIHDSVEIPAAERVRDGYDTIFGGDGNDTINVYFGNDLVDGGPGDDVIQANGNRVGATSFPMDDDTLIGGEGNDTINASPFTQTLQIGGDGDDLLLGHALNDTFIPGGGNDTIRGDALLIGGFFSYPEPQNDTFIFSDDFGADRILDFGIGNSIDADIIDLSDVTNITDYADLIANHLSEDADGNAVITDGDNSITLLGVGIDLLSARDFFF